MFTRPKLTDKIYGQMFWEDWDEDEAYWYAPVEIEGERVSLLIEADSPMDFFAAARTHSTYQRILQTKNSIRAEMVAEVLENSRELFKKKRQKISAGETISKNLKLFSIKIFQDLSAEINFVGNYPEDEDPDETFYALIDDKGKLIDAGISEL